MDRLQSKPRLMGGVSNKIVARAGLQAALRLIEQSRQEKIKENWLQYLADAERISVLLKSVGANL